MHRFDLNRSAQNLAVSITSDRACRVGYGSGAQLRIAKVVLPHLTARSPELSQSKDVAWYTATDEGVRGGTLDEAFLDGVDGVM